MKWLIVIAIFVFSICALGTNKAYRPVAVYRDTVPQGAPQLFGAKNYEFKNYVLVDSFIMNRGGDTNNIPFWPAFKFKRSDMRWYAYDSISWKRLLYANDSAIYRPNLQQVTDVGQKTNDTIVAGGLRTSHILGDTLNQDDFEIDVFPDLQVMTHPLADSSIVGSMFNWVVANKTTENIKAVLQVGDLVSSTGVGEGFPRVDSNFDKLDAAGIPIFPVPGNHDYDGGNISGSRPLTVFNSYFGPSRFIGKSYYGGSFHNSHANYYIKFDAGGHKYLALGLEFIPTDTALNWAQRVLDSFPDRETIIVTHAYMTHWGEKSMDTSKYATNWYGLGNDNDGQDMWNKLIRKKENKQIFMVVNGHFIFRGNTIEGGLNNTLVYPPSVGRITEAGEAGNVIYQMVVNYQTDSVGGNGYFMRLKFKPRTGKLDVSFYSPYVNRYDARFPSYTLDYPAIKVDGAVGISGANGSLNVAGESRFDSSVYLTKIPKHRLLITEVNGKIDTISNSDSAKFLASYGIIAKPQFRSLTTTDVPYLFRNGISKNGDSVQLGQYLGAPGNPAALINSREIPMNGFNTLFTGTGKIGVGTSSPFTNIDVNGTLGVSDRGYPTAGLGNNLPCRMYVVHGASNNGLGIIRATASSAGVNISLFKTRSDDPTVRAAALAGDELGRIVWYSVSGDNATVVNSANIKVTVGTPVTNNFPPTFMGFFVSDYSNSGNAERLRISPIGNLYVGGGVEATDRIHVAGTARITDTLKQPNIASKVDTTSYKPVIVDASGNYFKMAGWPLTATSYTFTNGITNSSGTVKLGGSLTEATTISSATAANNITVSGVNTSGEAAMLKVTTTGSSGFAIHGESSTGRGVYGLSGSSGVGVYGQNTSTGTGVFGNNTSSGYGGQFQSSSGAGLYAISSGSHAAELFTNRSSTNTSVPILKLYRLSQSAGANDIGGTIEFNINTTQGAGFSILANELTSKLTTATAGAEVSQFEISTLNGGSGTRARKLALTGPGQLILDGYGVSTFTGTAATMPAFTSVGNIIEVPVNLTGSATLDFPNTAAGSSSDLTITVTGAADGDVVAIGVPNGSSVANGCFTAWVSATNTVTIRYSNNDPLTAYNPASGTFKATIIKH